MCEQKGVWERSSHAVFQRLSFVASATAGSLQGMSATPILDLIVRATSILRN